MYSIEYNRGNILKWERNVKKEDVYAGVYLDYDNNEPNLTNKANGDGTYKVIIGIFRLVVFEDGIGKLSENGLENILFCVK